ncbi:hypothetical protein [Paenibacillus solani]|uniref:hypothetical protein n=1 Tax=Paenibacillus solani TaxID=1705565 RepID=UPI003D2C9446
MIKKVIVCAFTFIVILAAAIAATILSHPDGQQETYSTRINQWQDDPQAGPLPFSPREYVRIIRWSPGTTLPNER